MQALTYQGIKVENDLQKSTEDSLVIEAPLQININEQPYTVVMRTPNADTELIRGLLFAEDIYKSATNFKQEIVEVKKDQSTIINVQISQSSLGKGYLNKRTLLSVSSCGICGKQQLEDLKVDNNQKLVASNFQIEAVQKMFSDLQQQQKLFKLSGGSHAAGIFNNRYQLLSIKEDIGRHNAVDKCIGDLLLQNQLKEGKILLVSGRVSYEIVSKAFIAKIPLVIAVSACSSLAVDFAKEFGICLIGFTRDNKMTIYANPDYLKNS